MLQITESPRIHTGSHLYSMYDDVEGLGFKFAKYLKPISHNEIKCRKVLNIFGFLMRLSKKL